MPNNIEVILTGKDAGFTDTLRKAADTLSAKNTEIINSLGGVSKALDATGTTAAATGAEVSESAAKYTQLSDASKNLAAAQVLARTQIRELKDGIRDGTVEAVAGKAAILELEAAVKVMGTQYAAATRAITSSATDVVNAHGRISVSGQLMLHSVRASADSFAAGLPPMMIFTEQLGRLGEAAALSGGEGALGRLGAFMGGPWGIVIVGAVSVLGTMISHLDLFKNELGDATDKLEKQAHANDIARQAQAQFDSTLEGSIEKERKLNEELERRIKNQAQLNQQQTTETASNLDDARSKQSDAQRAFNAKKTAMDEAQAAFQNPAVGTEPEQIQALAQAFRTAEANFAKAQNDLIKANALVMNYEHDLRMARALELQDQAKAQADPRLAQRKSLEDQQTAVTNKYLSGDLSEAAYTKQFADLQTKIDSLGKSTDSASGALGNMVALIQQLFPGAKITSTTNHSRYTADGRISDHVLDRAVDFVPGGGMGQYTTAQVEQMLKDAGVHIRRNATGTEQFFGPGRGPHGPTDHSHDNHFHVAFDGSPSPESADRVLKEAADRQTRQSKEFTDMSASLDASLLQAKRANLTDADQIAAIARQQVMTEQGKLIADIEAKAALNPQIAAHKDALEELVKQAATQKLITIDTQEAQRKIADRLKLDTAANDNLKEILSLQESLALTQDERRKIQLSILAIEKEEERQRLQALIDNPLANPNDRAVARGDIGTIDQRYDLRGQQIRNQTRGPLDQYLADNDPKLINQKVETLMVQEIDSVRTGIDDALSRALGTRDPMVIGLIDLLLQQLLFEPIARALQKHGGGAGLGIGSLFSRKASIGGDTGNLEGNFDKVFGGTGTMAASTASLTTAGTSLTTAGTQMSAAAVQLQAAATTLSTSAAAGVTGSGGGLLGNILGVAKSFVPGAGLTSDVAKTIAENAAIFASGGPVRGAGSETSDSIPARLSNGEFVVTAEAARRVGVDNLVMLNRGNTPRFATGGPVGWNVNVPMRRGSNDKRGSVRSVSQYFNVSTPDADSFRRSERQILSDSKRRLARA